MLPAMRANGQFIAILAVVVDVGPACVISRNLTKTQCGRWQKSRRRRLNDCRSRRRHSWSIVAQPDTRRGASCFIGLFRHQTELSSALSSLCRSLQKYSLFIV